MNYVYHGSHISNLKKIVPNYSTHGEKWVYASFSKAVPLIFLSNRGNDLYYYLAGDGSIEYPLVLVERKKDMFKDIFNVSGSIYTLDSKNFINNKTGWSAEVISSNEEEVIEEEYIENVYDELLKLKNSNQLKLYLYPDRPDNIPLDNSDLIPKVYKWYKNGFNIEHFFELYPELKKRFYEYFNNQ